MLALQPIATSSPLDGAGGDVAGTVAGYSKPLLPPPPPAAAVARYAGPITVEYAAPTLGVGTVSKPALPPPTPSTGAEVISVPQPKPVLIAAPTAAMPAAAVAGAGAAVAPAPVAAAPTVAVPWWVYLLGALVIGALLVRS